MQRTPWVWVLTATLASCGDDDGSGLATTDATTNATGTAATSGGSADDESGSMPIGELPHQQRFDGPDGAPWPDPWREVGDQVIAATLAGGRGRFSGNTGNVARMVLPGFSETDIDVTVTVEFEDWTQQGFGLYVRQNGGSLQVTNPPGQGYAAYVEGGYMQMLGVWRETDGVEEILAGEVVPGGEVRSDEPYLLRFQCLAEGGSTRLRTRIWPASEPEPAAWLVDIVDATPALQGAAGSFAVDIYNYVGTGNVTIDDLRIEPL
jgi:hypothetical protein